MVTSQSEFSFSFGSDPSWIAWLMRRTVQPFRNSQLSGVPLQPSRLLTFPTFATASRTRSARTASFKVSSPARARSPMLPTVLQALPVLEVLAALRHRLALHHQCMLPPQLVYLVLLRPSLACSKLDYGRVVHGIFAEEILWDDVQQQRYEQTLAG